MMVQFFNWMYAPGQWNDIIVYLTIFMVILIIGMVFNKN